MVSERALITRNTNRYNDKYGQRKYHMFSFCGISRLVAKLFFHFPYIHPSVLNDINMVYYLKIELMNLFFSEKYKCIYEGTSACDQNKYT